MIGRLGGERAREEIRSYRATRPLLRDTISLTMLQGGYKINIIPEQAEMSFDCRLLPDTDERAFISQPRADRQRPGHHVRRRLAERARRDGALGCRQPVPADRAGVQGARAVERGRRRRSVRGRHGRAASSASAASRRTGWCRACFTAEDLKGYHGIDERLSLENLTLGTKIILDLTARLATA